MFFFCIFQVKVLHWQSRYQHHHRKWPPITKLSKWQLMDPENPDRKQVSSSTIGWNELLWLSILVPMILKPGLDWTNLKVSILFKTTAINIRRINPYLELYQTFTGLKGQRNSYLHISQRINPWKSCNSNCLPSQARRSSVINWRGLQISSTSDYMFRMSNELCTFN